MPEPKYKVNYFSIDCSNQKELTDMQKKINNWSTTKLLAAKPVVESSTATHYLFKIILFKEKG